MNEDFWLSLVLDRDENFFPKNYKNSDFEFDLAKVRVNKEGEFEFIIKRGEY